MQYNGMQIFHESAVDCNMYVPGEVCPSVTSSYKDSEISHINHFVLWDISKWNASIDVESACTVGFVVADVFLLEADHQAVTHLGLGCWRRDHVQTGCACGAIWTFHPSWQLRGMKPREWPQIHTVERNDPPQPHQPTEFSETLYL